MSRNRPSWYALYVRAQFEQIVVAGLIGKCEDAFAPTYVVGGRMAGHRTVRAPLFPRHVFCRAHVADLRPLLMSPGVMHIVGSGTQPLPVDEREIGTIKLAVGSGLACQPCPYLLSGRRGRVAGGPLGDLEGILAGTVSEPGIVLGISLLQRAILVKVGRGTQVLALGDTVCRTKTMAARVS